MATLTSLCVYCGSATGADTAYAALARKLGRRCAADGVTVVFGGGRVGLMGILAEAAMDAGGEAVGIIPEHLRAREVGYDGLSELIVVDSMHTRKALMAERADAFCVLPGGIGTLDEMVEIITWKQLGLHDKPIVLLDHDGYWQPLLQLFQHQQQAGFLRPEHARLFSVVGDLDGMFQAIAKAPESTMAPSTARI
ncbi:TIGR00730 family Rossman fold protein [Ferruginivarius sediminum]|uniref:Cytokinin riboside 5'-monophosphate phosphoribohydrolase n=1 Tax=Ferruginivarius sediminum TaxID=2661937 RepID=A0A369T6C4_9PROT|nr:TIGR00730 family Rossman fold protein [Ferruginivarius sediminum]RDD60870.1 TIGR00730 family Rossman fold protein [Ferruginivarius sediminum]